MSKDEESKILAVYCALLIFRHDTFMFISNIISVLHNISIITVLMMGAVRSYSVALKGLENTEKRLFKQPKLGENYC